MLNTPFSYSKKNRYSKNNLTLIWLWSLDTNYDAQWRIRQQLEIWINNLTKDNQDFILKRGKEIRGLKNKINELQFLTMICKQKELF